MTKLDDLYSARILDLAANTPPAPRLGAPDSTASAHSKLCGSTVTVDLEVAGGEIVAYGHTVKACLLGQASAAVVAGHAVGTKTAEFREVARKMRAMLKAGGPPPDGRWADLAALEPVREVKARHASTLLVFDAVERALDEIEAKRGAEAGAVGAPA